MNLTRVEQAVADIKKNEAALKWLLEYGPKITGRDRDQASVRIDLHFAGSCPGSKEAGEVIESFARIDLPNIISVAIRNCRNTIAIAKDAILEEVAPDGR